jgi:hypothetical protein
MNTKLNLTSSGTIELNSDISMSLNYSIAELQNIEAINGSFSKTITVSGTKNNNRLLGHLFNEGVSLVAGGYNTNLKAPCSIDVDEVTVLRGNMRIARVRIMDGHKIEYDLEITGHVGSLFTAMGDLELTDLDFSQYDHIYNYINQQNSWDTSIKVNDVDTAFQLGRGYVYPLIEYGLDPARVNYYHDNIYPALYVKTILDALFQQINFTYESDFFNSDFFKRLIFVYSGDSFRLSNDTVLARIFKASTNVDYVYSVPIANTNNVTVNQNLSLNEYKRVQFQNDSTGGNSDAGNQWNTSTSGGIVAQSGYYNISAQLEIQVTNPPTSYNPSINAVNDVVIFYLMVSEIVYGVENCYYYAGQTVYMNYFSSYYGNTNKTLLFNIPNVFIKAGDKVFVSMVNTNVAQSFAWGGYTTATTYNVRVLQNSFIKLDVANVNIVDGTEITMESTLPEDYKASDFFKGIVKMFNLYIEVDKDNANNLIIAPRNEFYTSGTTLDWSSKLDRGRGLEIMPSSQLDNKEYEFKYKNDTDNYNKAYQDKWFYSYSRKLVKVVTDLFKDRKVVELPFAATPSVGYNNSNRVNPAIFTTENGVNKRKKTVPRILYYGGLKTCAPAWKHWDRNTTTYSERTVYPYAGMVDDPYNPTVSLDIGVPSELYWNTDSYTNNNLFNKYYREMVDEMTDPDNKLVMGYFNLSAYDMSKFDFRNTIYIDGVNYHVNKIEDYNPVTIGLTKVELIKIKKTKSFEATTATLNGAINTYFVPNDIPHLDLFDIEPIRGFDQFSVNSTPPDSNYPVLGERNFVDSLSYNINLMGDNNNVTNSSNVTISGSSENLIDGAKNVSMVNTSGSTVMSGAQNVSMINSSGILVLPNVRNVSVVNSSGLIIDTSNTIAKANVVEVNGDVTSGVKTYVALFSQSGTSVPTATLLEDTTRGSLGSWSRPFAGKYILTITGITQTNTVTQGFGNWEGNAGTYVTISDQSAVLGYLSCYVGQNDELFLEVYDSGWNLVDYSTLLGTTKFPIDLKIYV